MKTASTIHRRSLKNRTRAPARCSGVKLRRACIETTVKRTGNPTCTYESRGRLESCSRDPIGFEGSPWGLYEYVRSRPSVLRDPTGLIPPGNGPLDPTKPRWPGAGESDAEPPREMNELYALQISLHMLDPKGTQKFLPPVLPPELQPKLKPFVIPKEPKFLKTCPTPPECRWSYSGKFKITRDREFVWDWFVEEVSSVGWPAWVQEDASTVPVGRPCKVEVDATMTCREECRLPGKEFFPNGKTKTVGATFTAEGIVEIVPGFGKQCSANAEVGESMTNYECK